MLAHDACVTIRYLENWAKNPLHCCPPFTRGLIAPLKIFPSPNLINSIASNFVACKPEVVI